MGIYKTGSIPEKNTQYKESILVHKINFSIKNCFIDENAPNNL
jgi:hypothetical protein